MPCPGEDELLLFTQGTLSGSIEERVQNHLAECTECRQVVAEVARSLSQPVDLSTTASPLGGSSQAPTANLRTPEPSIVGTLTHLGRYRVISVLGAGGMGVVYSGWDPQLNRAVALKLVRTVAQPDEAEKARGRLLREAQAMAQLSHPNVVHVYDAGTHDDKVFLAMELVRGQNLRQWLKETRPAWREALQTFLAAGEGLHAAHAAGLVHRDFKPDNVLLGQDGRVRVTDFGLARVESFWAAPRPGAAPQPGPRRPPTMTEAGVVMGTPAYMPPEQLRGEPTDSRSDQFSFCVALYEALFGERPFGGTAFELHNTPASFKSLEPLPDRVLTAIARGLDLEPKARFGTMRELLDELIAGLESPIAPRRRSRPVAAVVTVLAVACLTTAGALWVRWLVTDDEVPVPEAPVTQKEEPPATPSPAPAAAEVVPPAPLPPPEEVVTTEPATPPARARPAKKSSPKVPGAKGKLQDREPGSTKEDLNTDPWDKP